MRPAPRFPTLVHLRPRAREFNPMLRGTPADQPQKLPCHGFAGLANFFGPLAHIRLSSPDSTGLTARRSSPTRCARGVGGVRAALGLRSELDVPPEGV